MSNQYLTKILPQMKYIKELKETGYIPKELAHIFSDTCECGGYRVGRLTDGQVTMITCVEDSCIYKIAGQLQQIFAEYKIQDFGMTTFLNVLEKLPEGYKSVNVVLCTDQPEHIPFSGKQQEKFIAAIKQIRSTQLTLGQFIRRLSYPFITEKHIENLVSDYDANIALIRDKRLHEFMGKYGMNMTLGLFSLISNLELIDHIVQYHKSLNVFRKERSRCMVCMSGNLAIQGKSISKRKFINNLNAKLYNHYRDRGLDTLLEFDEVSSVTSANFVVVGENAVTEQTPKFRKAKGIHMAHIEAGKPPFLFREDDFISFVEDMIKKVEDDG